MNVAFKAEPVTAQQAWFDPRTGDLHAVIHGIDYALRLASIPDDDFESSAPVVGFKVGCGGAVVICSHKDGEETWLPVDMWLPGGFTTAV